MSDTVGVIASNSGFANVGGGKLWVSGSGPTFIDCPLGQMEGSATAVWLVGGDPIPNGQTLYGVRFDGQHAYIVDVGGAGKTRLCTAYGGVGTTPASVSANLGLGTVVGTGVGATILTTIDTSGIGVISDHYNNGTLYVGVAASTDAADSFYTGLYHFEALNWTLFFGAPPPPVDDHTPVGHFTNPIANTTPGKRAGVEQFDSITFTVDKPSVAAMNWVWTFNSASGLTFVSSGTRNLSQTMGYNNHSPGNINSTGKINIPASTPPGNYTLTMRVTSMTAPASPTSLTMTTTVRVRTIGGVFMEF